MPKRNSHLDKLQSAYLFAEVAEIVARYKNSHPNALCLSLSIGDTTEPIPECIANEMANAAANMQTREGYHGYGPFQGLQSLRAAISKTNYSDILSPDEIFISDGAKPDIGRLPLLFDNSCRVAVQTPAYPAYIDTSVITGKTGSYDSYTKQYEGIIYLQCTPDNDFFPDLTPAKRADLLYFCSPNNPTGAAASKEQLTELVAFAKKNRIIIIYDAAYADYIRDPAIARSIYEIEGAKEVAIEINSFSKTAGFTGLRLGWTAVPKELAFDDGSSVHSAWSRIISTFFNGASYIAQIGGLAALSEKGRAATKVLTDHYLQNVACLKEALCHKRVYGGSNVPYLWIDWPGKSSWETFHYILEKSEVIVTPGIGFGSEGDNFIRISAFGSRLTIQDAAARLAAL